MKTLIISNGVYKMHHKMGGIDGNHPTVVRGPNPFNGSKEEWTIGFGSLDEMRKAFGKLTSSIKEVPQ